MSRSTSSPERSFATSRTTSSPSSGFSTSRPACRMTRRRFSRNLIEFRVSSKLNVESNKKNAGALNHAIVGFGQEMDYVLEKPRDDIDQIGRAMKHLKID